MNLRILAGLVCLIAAGQADAATIVTDPNTGDTPLFIQLLGINNAGAIVGYTGMGTPNPNRGFTLTLPNSFTSLNPNLTGGFTNAQTQVFGISGSGNTTVGFVIDTNGVTHGFVDVGNGPTATPVDDPAAVSNANPAVNQLLGIDQSGVEAAGFYTDASGVDHGYTYNIASPAFASIIPNIAGFSTGDSVMATGVNNSGEVTGFFTAGANSMGFLFDGSTLYTAIDVPGASSTQPLSLNDLGQVVGTYVGADGLNHGFVYSAGSYYTFDGIPGAPMNLIQGINDHDQIVGFAVTDALGTNVGFTAIVPEPATFLMIGIAFLAAALALRWKARRS